jgi:hypothetical protein
MLRVSILFNGKLPIEIAGDSSRFLARRNVAGSALTPNLKSYLYFPVFPLPYHSKPDFVTHPEIIQTRDKFAHAIHGFALNSGDDVSGDDAAISCGICTFQSRCRGC